MSNFSVNNFSTGTTLPAYSLSIANHHFPVFEETQLIKNGLVNVTQNKNTFTASKFFGPGKELFGKVHLLPQMLDFGLISGEKSEQMEIWNTNDDPVAPTGVTEFDVYNFYFKDAVIGVNIDPFTSSFIDVYSNEEGPQVVDFTPIFSFSSGENVGARFVATREIDSFLFTPIAGSQENYSFYTDVLKSIDSSEQRLNLTLNSNLSFSYKFLLENNDLQKAEAQLNKKYGSTILVPKWNQRTPLGQAVAVDDLKIFFDTNLMDLQQNQYFAIIENDEYYVASADTVEVDGATLANAITKSFSVEAEVVPLYMSTFSKVTKRYYTNKLFEFAVNFDVFDTEVDTIIPVSYTNPTYNNRPLLLSQPNRTVAVNEEFQRDTKIRKSSFGPAAIFDQSDQNYNTKNHQYLFKNKQEIQQFKSFLKDIGGNQKSFYMPSFQDDLTLQPGVDFLTANDFIVIKNINYVKSFASTPRHIIINYNDGTYSCFKVIASQKIDDNYEQLTLDRNLEKTTSSDIIDNISFINKCRFVSPASNFNFITNEVCELRKNIKILKNEN